MPCIGLAVLAQRLRLEPRQPQIVRDAAPSAAFARVDGRAVFFRRDVGFDQVAGDRRVARRQLARFFEGGDRLVVLAELLIGEAEMRQQDADVERRRRRLAADTRRSPAPARRRPPGTADAPRALRPARSSPTGSCRSARSPGAPCASAASRSPSRRCACDSRYSARASVVARPRSRSISASRALLDLVAPAGIQQRRGIARLESVLRGARCSAAA